MKRVLSHFSYLAFFGLGVYIAFCGVEDFALLLFGKITDATVISVSTQRVRVGKRGHGVQHYAKYAFTTPDGDLYHGSGEMDTGTPPEKDVKMEVRYLSFHPAVNGPKNDVLSTGVMLMIVGVFLSFVVFAAWRRKRTADRASAATPGS